MLDLTLFSNGYKSNMSISVPWSRGEYSYATNGHIMIRVPRREDVPERAEAPDLSSMDTFWSGKNYAPLPSIPANLLKICGECRGEGRMVECDTCDGKGQLECCECGGGMDCVECEGVGAWPASGLPDRASVICWSCHGMGEIAMVVAVALSPSRRFNSKYLLMLAQLPGLAFSIDAGAEADASHFTFDGGEGLLMPMRSGDFAAYAQKAAA